MGILTNKTINMNKGTNEMLTNLAKKNRASKGPISRMQQTGINIDYNYSAVLMKVVRCKSETRIIDEEEYLDSLCRDTRTDEELAQKSTLASSKRIMKMMIEQK